MALVQHNYFSLLPPEVFLHILSYFDLNQIGKIAVISKHFKEICYDDGIYRILDLSSYGQPIVSKILNSILGKRTRQLQFLNISSCFDIKDDMIKKIAATCQNLKQIDLGFCAVSSSAIKLLPRTCKVLRGIQLKRLSVKIYSDVVNTFTDFLEKKYLYHIFTLKDGSNVTVIKSAPYKLCANNLEDTNEFTQFVKLLPEDKCVYALYNFKYIDDSNKILFLLWAPETARLKEKVLYTGVKTLLMTALNDNIGFPKLFKLQATEIAELQYDDVNNNIERYM